MFNVKAYSSFFVNVSLSCIFPSKVVVVGSVVGYDVDVGYVGGYRSLYVRLRVEGDVEGWGWRFVYGGSEISGVNLLNNSQVTVRLLLDVPEDASPGVYTFYVVAEFDAYPYKSRFKLEVLVKERTPILNVYCRFPYKVVSVGGSVVFDLIVDYDGPLNHFDLSCLDLPLGWGALFRSDGSVVRSMVVEGKYSGVLSLEVSVPVNASSGYYKFFASFTSRLVNVSVPLEVWVEPLSEARVVDVFVEYPAVSVEVGKNAYFDMTLRNVGSRVEVLHFNVIDLPSGWSVEFLADGKSIWGLSLKPNTEQRVSVRVSPPVDVKFGVYGFVVNVASVDGVINESFELSVRIVGKPEIHIRLLETPTLSLTAVAGESLKLTVEVSNYGTLNVTDVYLEVKVPSIDWDYVVKPSKISVIKPGESANFTLTLTLSSIIIPGDYMIDLTVHSKQASSNSLSLRVTVTKPTEWGYLIVGGVVVLVVLLFAFFRLKGRR